MNIEEITSRQDSLPQKHTVKFVGSVSDWHCVMLILNSLRNGTVSLKQGFAFNEWFHC